MSEYEKVYFDKWQDLAKAVIDGGEIYFFKAFDDKYIKITLSDASFCVDLSVIFNDRDFYIKKQPTLQELIAIKPRLCWVWDDDINYKYIRDVNNYNDVGCGYKHESFVTEKSRCIRWKNA